MTRSKKSALVLAAAVVGVVGYTNPGEAATLTWTGASPDPNSATYVITANGTAAGLLPGDIVYNFNGVPNWSSDGGPVNFTVGDDVFLSDASGRVLLRQTAAGLNPTSMTFYHDPAGSAATEFWFLRGDELTSGGSGLGSSPAWGTNHSSTLTLDTGFLGTVHIRPRALTGTFGNTIIRGGILELNDALPAPNTGNANAPNITLDGGELRIKINTAGNNNPAGGNLIGTLTVLSNSTLSNGETTRTPINQGATIWNGPITVPEGVTLTVKSYTTVRANLSNSNLNNILGTFRLADEGENISVVGISNQTAHDMPNALVDLGTDASELLNTAAGTLTFDFGALTGGPNTKLSGSTNTGAGLTIYSVGSRGDSTTFQGVIRNNINGVSVAALTKVGAGSLTLTNDNTYTGATTVNGGVLVVGGANGAISGSPTININTGGTLRVDNSGANNNNRLLDTTPISLNQGNFEFVGNLAANTAEAAGTLNIVGAANNVRAIASGAGGTAAITFAALNRTAGAVNFDTAAGTNINFAEAPTPINGIIGGYATANGESWAGLSGNSVTEYTHGAGETNTAPGTWTNTQNINLTAGGTSNVTASTTVNTLRLGSAVNVAIGAGAGLTIEGGGILAPGTFGQTISGAGSLTAGSGVEPADLYVQVPNAANTLTINSAIADNGASGALTLVKLGAGKLVLGGAQSYTGGLSIGGGTVAAGANNVFNGGTLTIDFGNTFDIAGFSQTFDGVVLINGTLDNSGGAATVSSGTFNVRSGTVNAALGGSGGLTKTTGGGVVTLNVASNYTGGTIVGDINPETEVANGGGTLILGVANALPTGGSLTINNGTVSIGAFNQSLGQVIVGHHFTGDNARAGNLIGTTGVVTSNADFVLNNGTVSAILGGSSGVNKETSNTATLSASNTYTGATTILGGTLAVGVLANGGQPSSIGQSSNAAANLVIGSGTLLYTGPTVSTDRNITLNGDGAIFTTGAGTQTWTSTSPIAGSGNLILGGANAGENLFNPAITGGISLRKVSGGQWLLGQANNTSGGQFDVQNGTLNIQGFNQTIGNFILGSDNPASQGSVIGTGILTATGSDLKAGTLSVVLAGNFDLNKNGAANQTATLTAANTVTGPVNINSGTLAVSILVDGGQPSGLGQSSAAANNLRLNGGGTLSYVGAGGSTNRLFSLNGDAGIASSGAGAIQFTNTGSIENDGPELRLVGTNTLENSFAPLIHGSTRLLKANAGQWLVTNTNTYTGSTTITGGTLTISNIANGGVNSNIGASSNEANNLVIGGGTAGGGGGVLKYTGSGAAIDRLFTIGLTNPGAAAGSGGIDSSGTGALQFTNTAEISSGSGTAARVLTLSGSNTGNNSIAGILRDADTGAGSLLGVTKTGTGKWILSGANTYTGATVVNGGTLQLNNAAHGPVLNPPAEVTTAFANIQAGNLVLDYTGGSSVAADVLAILDAGYDLPTKFSAGQIRSTTVTAAIGLGWRHDAGAQQVLVKRTYYGDADLNGQVDVADLGILASNWQTAGNWITADFDYSGFIDVNDLGLLASNWQAGVGAPLGTSFQEALASVGLGNVAVPEPSALGLLGLGALALKRRRRI